MIQLPQGFKVAGREAIDVRLILSKAEMFAINDNTMPDVYFAICKNDGKLYVYNKLNTMNEETGKYRLYAEGGGSSSVSTQSGNIIQMVEDGLYASESESITNETIQQLFD